MIGWENWNQTSDQQDVKMSWRGGSWKAHESEQAVFIFLVASPLSGALDKTAMLRRLMKIYERSLQALLYSFLLSSLPLARQFSRGS